jgi:hypothetical protein
VQTVSEYDPLPSDLLAALALAAAALVAAWLAARRWDR